MHICYVCDEYPPLPHGGVGTVVQALGRAMVARGHAVTVVGISPREAHGTTVDQGITVIRLPHTRVRGGGFLLNGRRLRRTLRRVHRQRPIDILEGPEIGFAFMPRRLPFATVIRMNGGHHFFAVTLGGRPRWWRSRLERRSFARASHVCAASQFVATTTRRLLGLEHRDIPVIPNPVDVNAFSPASSSTADANLVLFVGTVCEKKGIRQLVDAMPRIIEAVPQARLVVCGRDSEEGPHGGSFIAHLQGKIPPQLAGRVTFQGAIPHAEISQWIAQAAVCVYPSHMEALPLAWLEGLAMGKAVVASDIGPGPEVVEDGVSGLLCNPHDPRSIADRVIRVLRDPALRTRLGAEARRRAVTTFSLEKLVVRNETFYADASRGFGSDQEPALPLVSQQVR